MVPTEITEQTSESLYALDVSPVSSSIKEVARNSSRSTPERPTGKLGVNHL